jgi:hypothetical protein
MTTDLGGPPAPGGIGPVDPWGIVVSAPVEPVDVKLLRWPADAARRDQCRALGLLRLLVVEGGVHPPVTSDLQEDWVRTPISQEDLQARIAALRARAEAQRRPQVDPHGVLRFAGRSTPISPTATDLLECLVREFGVLVPRDRLRGCLPENVAEGNRNVLDLHIMRLRKRIQPVGLVIRTVWGRGYLLEPAPAEGPGLRRQAASTNGHAAR